MDRRLIRKQVEEALGRSVRDGVWRHIDKRVLPDLTESQTLIEDLIHEVEQAEALADEIQPRRRPANPPRFVGRPPRGYADAVSVLVAAIAAQDDDVVAFRRRVLRGRLLDWDRVGDWIKQRPGPRAKPQARPGARKTYVQYSLPGIGNVLNWPAPPGSELETLAQIADRLHRNFAWDRSQATVFILTGVTPYMAPIRTTIDPLDPWLGAAQRIILTIDPATPEAAVIQAYREARDAIAPGQRFRSMNDKRAALAVFAFGDERQDQTWQARMAAWNRQAKKLAPRGEDWTYTVDTIFARDATQARRRLLRLADEAGPEKGARKGGKQE
jgi:hypothetical protein